MIVGGKEMFNLTTEELQTKQALTTATEIYQQPEVWQELVNNLIAKKDSMQSFLNMILAKHEQVRVIFTGAGTSAFIGDIVAPVLQKENLDKLSFESVPTTDIVSNPDYYLQKDKATIMVSFARSGNSPESVASVALGEQKITDFYQVVITCNKDGQLAKNSKEDKNSIILLTPTKAHDQGFAMTSSFSSMILTAFAFFSPTSFFNNEMMKHLISNGGRFVSKVADVIDEILDFDFTRLVYLGSGPLAQLSHEAALKMLELSAGKVVAVHESTLGFRHGPKSILNEQSLAVMFLSSDPYTRKYDLDMLKELSSEDSGMKVIVLTEKEEEKALATDADWVIAVNDGESKFDSDFYLSLLYVIFAQTLALKKSIQLGITPDNPSPDGKVNRVVKGVTIYPN